ncbi:hypothetical protein NDU88_005825 [Pleurodeles waltl]|uniref:Uncharacterized protein n=1 Tax=Pleurodeles waltl TaxID=8319 RepID=A0AAV7RQ42_PLEWA|nr:hypothetical protein NDU88_005825 [Pleurodeles waltl]
MSRRCADCCSHKTGAASILQPQGDHCQSFGAKDEAAARPVSDNSLNTHLPPLVSGERTLPGRVTTRLKKAVRTGPAALKLFRSYEVCAWRGSSGWKKLEREITQQEDVLTSLQSRVTSGDVSEADCRLTHAKIGAMWNRLDSYIRKDYRQRLYREGDCSGHMLAWLLKCERPLPTILSLQGPTREKYLGHVRVILLLQDHRKDKYSSPKNKDEGQVYRYLDGLHIARLIEAQTEELEREVTLGELQEALGAMVHGKTPGPDGIPTEFYRAHSAVVLP